MEQSHRMVKLIIVLPVMELV